MNAHNFSPTLFDARFHGVYTFESVLSYHKSIENQMPIDGLVWLCEHANLAKLQDKRTDLRDKIMELEKGMEGQPYGVWTVLDKQAHILRTRLQLVSLRIDSLQK